MSDEETASILRAMKEQLNRVEMRQMEIIERLRLIASKPVSSTFDIAFVQHEPGNQCSINELEGNDVR